MAFSASYAFKIIQLEETESADWIVLTTTAQHCTEQQILSRDMHDL